MESSLEIKHKRMQGRSEAEGPTTVAIFSCTAANKSGGGSRGSPCRGPGRSLLQKLLRGRARRYRNRHSCDNRRTSRKKEIKKTRRLLLPRLANTTACRCCPRLIARRRAGALPPGFALPVCFLCRRVRKPRGRAHLPAECARPSRVCGHSCAGWASLSNILGGSCSKTTARPRSGIKAADSSGGLSLSLSFRETPQGAHWNAPFFS